MRLSVSRTILQNKLIVDFYRNFIFSSLCVFASLRGQFHAKAQRRKVYIQYFELANVMQLLNKSMLGFGNLKFKLYF
jgi:hypothetical protein